jgi:hypothetical protein
VIPITVSAIIATMAKSPIAIEIGLLVGLFSGLLSIKGRKRRTIMPPAGIIAVATISSFPGKYFKS